jgi:hypothetical protein
MGQAVIGKVTEINALIMKMIRPDEDKDRLKDSKQRSRTK